LRRKTSRFGERRRGNDFFAFRRHHPGVRFGSTYDSPACDPAGPADGAAPGDRAGLSTDYLNHYSEILMLIEMASFDEDAVADLSGWQPVDYRAYFERSPLRRAASALAAYEALAPQRAPASSRPSRPSTSSPPPRSSRCSRPVMRPTGC
jgi:hypothetical protein